MTKKIKYALPIVVISIATICAISFASDIPVAEETQALTNSQTNIDFSRFTPCDKESIKEYLQEWDVASMAYQQAVEDNDIDAMQAAQLAMDEAHMKAEAIRCPYYTQAAISSESPSEPQESVEPTSSESPLESPIVSQYTIVASTIGKGKISPAGSTMVNSNDSFSYTITPNVGFKIKDVTIDGVSVGKLSSYTFNNITVNHTISASFESTLTLSVGTPSISGLVNGSIKSGYGFGVLVPVTANGYTTVKATVGTKTYDMELVNGAYVLPRNPSSPSNPKARVHYIPVNTPSGTKLKVSITVVTTNPSDATDTLSKTLSTTVLVKGNMYDDDAVGDR